MVITLQRRQQYLGLSDMDMSNRVSELAMDFAKHSHSCGQSTVAAFYEVFVMDDSVVRVASSSCGGQARQMMGTCGALIGGSIVIDYFFGRPVEEMSHQEGINAQFENYIKGMDLVQLLYRQFIQVYGAIHCALLNQKFYGRIYWLADEEELAKQGKAAETCSPNCFELIGESAKWVMDIILAESKSYVPGSRP